MLRSRYWYGAILLALMVAPLVGADWAGPGLAFSVEGREVPATVPESASVMLTGCGLLAFARLAYRRKRNAPTDQ